MQFMHVLFDLAAHPDYLDELRKEIRNTYSEDGGWKKSSYSKLRKMDSLLRECQRFSPPSVLSMHRIMEESHTLSDQTKLPKGAHVCMATHAIQNDAQVNADPKTFDPMRSYRLRQKQGEAHMDQFATTERNMLNFGYGKLACPGRYFASLAIKVLLTKLIMDYDFKLLPQQTRPANMSAFEFVFPDREAELLVRRREKRGESPF